MSVCVSAFVFLCVCVCVVGVEDKLESALIDIMMCAVRQAAEATPPSTRAQKKVRHDQTELRCSESQRDRLGGTACVQDSSRIISLGLLSSQQFNKTLM